MNMIFRKLLTNGKIMLIATIALCTAIDPENETAIHLSYLTPVITPLQYDAKIRFSYKTNDIIGECNITILINRQTKNISMHPVIFAIIKIVLCDNLSNEQISISRYSFNNKLNMLTIDFSNTPKLPKFLTPGRYTLIITYMRHINNDKKYISAFSYFNENSDNILNATGVDIMTARQLFPCWDEITLNSTFKLSIKHHKKYSVLSNMPVQRTENDDKRDMMWTHFEKSPSMFIKHINVVITTFTNISTSVANITVWGRKNVTYYLQLAKSIAQQVLYFLKRENSIDKLPKIDYVVLWDTQYNTIVTSGLILQREVDIIYDEDLDSIRHKIKVSYFITYQIVSLWYSDVLLRSKIGFDTLLATYIFHQIPPDYDIMNLFIAETQWESLLFDTASNANETNSLSYHLDHVKPSNIWRMIQHLISADVFWTGIRTYVNSKQYNQTNDLWNMMQTIIPNNATAFIVKRLISIWIAEKYYPVLYVTRDYLTNTTIFEYLNFDFIDEDTEHRSTFVTYTTKSIMNFQDIYHNNSFWLSPQKPVKLVQEFDKDDWIIVNLRQIGYYRVNYDTENWLNLAQYMNSVKYVDIHVLNRAQIIDDAFYFFMHEQIDYVTFWKISAFLSREMNYVAWYPMFKAFEHMSVIVSIKDTDDLKEKMEKILGEVLYAIRYFAQQYESDLTECLREEAIKWACIIGNKKCREVANMEMTRYLHSESGMFVMQSEWKRWMYCNGLVSANKTIWYAVWYKWAVTGDIKFLEYSTCSEDPGVISHYLWLNFVDSILIKHNTRAHIFLLTVARHARNDIVCNFILQNLKNITFMFTSNTQADIIATLIVIITHQHAAEQLAKVLEFAKVNLREKRLVDAVQKKNKKRIYEHAKKVKNLGLIGLRRFK
ncbi:thyrotropin-releasing hormone-degrading ectoenzyme-like isoform X2 [Linepithema humile]|uniref:thyrotropin-releasing hormone-degrading ectoenzyme-like isoform X2 n=1 Tax=Linepithema humile TaxID=83485 RepID=UPI00351EF871